MGKTEIGNKSAVWIYRKNETKQNQSRFVWNWIKRNFLYNVEFVNYDNQINK